MTELNIEQLVLAKDIRIEGDAMSDEELLGSIQTHGIRVNLLVRRDPLGRETHIGPVYEIWDGRRRFRVGKIAGLTKFPCDIQEMNDLEAMLMAFTLNDQRQSMSVIEAGLWMKALLNDYAELTQESLAMMIGHTQSWLSRRLAAADQYEETPKETRRYLPKTERALRELRTYTPEKQQQILAGAKKTGLAPSAREMIRQAKATKPAREILEEHKYQDSEFLVYLLQEEAGLTLTDAVNTVKKFKARQLPWQQRQKKYDLPTRNDATVKLYAELAKWYPPEFTDFIENNLGAASSIETWRSRIQRAMRLLLQKAGDELRQSVLEEFRK